MYCSPTVVSVASSGLTSKVLENRRLWPTENLTGGRVFFNTVFRLMAGDVEATLLPKDMGTLREMSTSGKKLPSSIEIYPPIQGHVARITISPGSPNFKPTCPELMMVPVPCCEKLAISREVPTSTSTCHSLGVRYS